MTVPAESPAPAGASQTRVPDFFVVGHAKSGTTALFSMMRRHPQIHMPKKEPWFFAAEVHPPAAPRPAGTGKTPKTLEEYLSLFGGAMPEQRIGEASCLYLWSHTAARAIAEVNPDARIIAILREPASFLRSLHFQFVQVYLEPEKDLRRAIGLEDSRRQGKHLPSNPYWPGATLYSEHVRYVEQLRRYHEMFPAEQVLVLAYEDFRRDNEATVRKVWRFLEVDDTLPVVVREANPTVRVRSRRLYSLMHTVAAGEGPLPRAVQATARTLAPRRLSRESAMAIRDRIIYGAPRPPDESLMTELRHRFKGEVVALSEYLGRDFVTLWGYDKVP
ncbi:MAG TPA: sulfotransferase [Solirubrobacteraceae bacterium]|nr:sulfotransferase [Solirubrobacteraceae bacterium]